MRDRQALSRYGLQSIYREPTADRPLEPHEMTTEEFRQLPNVHHYGTYHGYIPEAHETNEKSAGIHLGSVDAASQRLADLLVYRPEEYGRGHATHSALIIPAKVSSLSHHQFNSPDDPTEDRGDDWRHIPDTPRVRQLWPDSEPDVPERVGKIEYYENEHEDSGSTSVRVPDRGMIQTQGDALHEAVKAGKPVNPVHRALYERIGDEAFAVRPSSRIADKPPRWRPSVWRERPEDLEEDHWAQIGTPNSDPRPLKKEKRRAA